VPSAAFLNLWRRLSSLQPTAAQPGLILRLRRLKPIAPARRRYLQMQRRMLRMSAIFQQRLGRLMARPNLRQLRIVMMFPKVTAQTALSIVKLQHIQAPFNGASTATNALLTHDHLRM
jgi:hypothetical protein